MRDEQTITAELAALQRAVDEAREQETVFYSPKERANREACLREMLGAAALVWLQAGEPVASQLLVMGRELRPDLAWIGDERVMTEDGYSVSKTASGRTVWKLTHPPG